MNDQLINYLFDDKPHTLTKSMNEWIGLSPRFKLFATTYRDKIRKKIRVTQGQGGILDLEAELETAFWLLQEKRFTVTYEPYGSEKTRGPDFAVSFKSMTFNLEVTRIRPGKLGQALDEGGSLEIAPEQVNSRLLDTICDKLGQMRPGMVNVLVVIMDETFVRLMEIEQAMTQLKLQAEHKDPALFGRYGFVKSADFFKYYLRLSGVVVRAIGHDAGKTNPVLWLNNQAKQAVPGPVRTILQRGLL